MCGESKLCCADKLQPAHGGQTVDQELPSPWSWCSQDVRSFNALVCEFHDTHEWRHPQLPRMTCQHTAGSQHSCMSVLKFYLLLDSRDLPHKPLSVLANTAALLLTPT